MRLLGHRSDVPDLLAAADVVVSSAVWEGQPVGIQEALHAGAAVVATDVGGTAAVVGDAALLVPPADPVSLSRAIRDVVLHGSVRDDLRSKAVERSGQLPTEAGRARRGARGLRVGPPGRRRTPDGGAGRVRGVGSAARPGAPSGWWPRDDVSLKPVVLQTTKQIFVTGGVASSLGKGLTASSLGHLLRARGLRVTMQKLDPYLNVDPGTMNPFQHGEVFVTDDGAETDLDIGHYERFLDVNLKGSANVTTGQVYNRRHPAGAPRGVPRRHRAGHPAHHERAQGADAGAGRRLARGLRRRGARHHHHRDRRHRRRHRVAAVPRGRAPGAPRPGPRQRLLPPRLARALPRARAAS